MTTEEAIEVLSDVGDINRCCAEDAEALDMAIEALKWQKMMTDLRIDYGKVKDNRPTGKWKQSLDKRGFLQYECTNCGRIIVEIDKFCPNCGARMVESEE